MTISANIPERFRRSPRPIAATHLFRVGETVRLKGPFLRDGDIFLITASLPPSGESPQYRIRNDNEKFERMARETELEAISEFPSGNGESLIQSGT
jgi:hypothetical protein